MELSSPKKRGMSLGLPLGSFRKRRLQAKPPPWRGMETTMGMAFSECKSICRDPSLLSIYKHWRTLLCYRVAAWPTSSSLVWAWWRLTCFKRWEALTIFDVTALRQPAACSEASPISFLNSVNLVALYSSSTTMDTPIEKLDNPTQSRLRSTQILTSLPQIVSELLQNALDAGATAVDVGLDTKEWTCWVKDNGRGITKGDLETIGNEGDSGRYSTSKPYAQNMMNAESTFGFRGEGEH